MLEFVVMPNNDVERFESEGGYVPEDSNDGGVKVRVVKELQGEGDVHVSTAGADATLPGSGKAVAVSEDEAEALVATGAVEKV